MKYKLIEDAMLNELSRGVSIWATMSSKYSLSPLKESQVRAGRTTRVRRGTSRFSLSARGRGDRNLRRSSSSLVNAERQVTNGSGEIYTETGMSERQR